MLRLAERLSQRSGQILLGLTGFGLGLVLIALLASGALIWRLNQGPLDVTGLAHRLEARFAPRFVSGRIVLSMQKTGGVHLLRLEVADVGRQGEGGRLTEFVRYAIVVAPLRRLARLDFMPTEIDATGARLEIMRSSGAGSRSFSLSDIGPLQRVGITDLQVTVNDAVLHTRWLLTNAAVSLERKGDGVAGHAEGTLATGDVSTHLAATGRLSEHGAHVEATSTPVSPANLARAVPALSGLAAFDAAIGLRASGDFGPALQLEHASLHAESGAGTVLLPAKGGATSPGHFASLSLDADGTPAAINLRGLHIVLAPPSGNPPSNVVIAATAKLRDGRVRAETTLDLDQANLSDLGAIWPAGVGGGSRPWLVENLTNGTAHDGHFNLTMAGNLANGDLALTGATGSMQAEDVTVWWLRPVPPVEHAHAVLSLVDGDTMLITGSGGRTAALVIKTASMRITGLSAKDQVSVLNVDMAGPLADVFTLLANPRLNLLSKRPVPLNNPSGAVVAHLTVNLPLDDRVTIDQIGIHATSKITDAHLGAVVAGKDLDHGQIAFDATNDGLKVTGTALLDQLPSKLEFDMDFRDGPASQVLEHAAAVLAVTPQAAQAAGLGVIGLQSGTLATTVDYAARRDDTALLSVGIDLKDAAIDTPIGWSKTAGAPGQGAGQALLDHGRLVGLQAIHANAPGLAISASSEFANGRVSVVHIAQGEIGRSSAVGSIVLPLQPGQPYRITLAGARLDLEGQVNKKGQGDKSASGAARTTKPGATGVPYVLDLRFDQVRFGPGQTIGPLSLQAAGTGQRLTSGHLVSRGPEQVEADLMSGPSERRLHAVTSNLGLLLRQTNLAHELNGGTMTLTGAFDDNQPSSPFSGTMDLGNFSVSGAPVTGKVLQALTVYGIAEALGGPGLVFDRLVAPFRLDGSLLQLNEARAFSSSLGVTTTGTLDFGRNMLSLDGTIVPAYAVNSLPGRVPFVGKLFSPEKGSGLFAANYSLRGAVDDPSISINPLSALTPGFLRNLFDVFR